MLVNKNWLGSYLAGANQPATKVKIRIKLNEFCKKPEDKES